MKIIDCLAPMAPRHPWLTLRRLAVLLVALLVVGAASGQPAPDVAAGDGFFQRYTDPDPRGLERDIETARHALAAARAKGDPLSALSIAADLGGMLTTARREPEAREILQRALDDARQRQPSETRGWLLLNLATANQYLHRSEEATAQFAEALEIARSLPSLELQHYTLQHWGRLLAETGEFERARACFSEALALRVRLDDPRQASSRAALQALDALERRRPR